MQVWLIYRTSFENGVKTRAKLQEICSTEEIAIRQQKKYAWSCDDEFDVREYSVTEESK